MRRRWLFALVSVGAAAVLPVATADAAPKATPAVKHCTQLKGHDLVPANPSIKLVRMPYVAHGVSGIDDRPHAYARSRYLICATPNGLVRTAADVGESDGYANSVGLRANAGTFLVFTVGGGATIGSYDAAWMVLDARTGHRVRFTSFDDSRASNRLPPPSALKVDHAGRVLALYSGGIFGPAADHPGIPAGHESLLISYGRSGERRRLDAGGTDAASTIPAGSLAITGTTAHWLHGPDRRTADLATPRAAASAVPTTATARSSAVTKARACRTAAHAKGAKVKRQSTTAIVFKRGVTDGLDRLYSCVLAVGKVRRLPLQEGTYKLGGVYFAYVYEGSAIGDESSKIGVIDLRTGHTRRVTHLLPGSEGALNETDDGGIIEAYAIAANGNLVWLTTGSLVQPGFDDTKLELRAGDGRPPVERIVDSGTITAGSLKLAASGRSVSYAKDGARLTQPLR